MAAAAACTSPPGNLDPLGYTFTDAASCAAAATDVVSAADPELGALADNGGPTFTHLPAGSSPIGGLVPPLACVVTTDQRLLTRPQGDGCEPGSVEIVEGPAPLNGTSGNDSLTGTEGDDIINGLGGDDLLWGRGGDDRLNGGSGSDLLIGDRGADRLEGGPGPDILLGTPGDTLVGGPGLDLCWFPGRILPRNC